MASVPLYLQIRDRIRAECLTGIEPVGDRRLPTERELQARFGVSRPTIAKALAALAAEGDLVSAQGRGRFVVARGNGSEPGDAARRIGYVASIATEVLTQRAFFGIERAARRHGYRVVMASANNRVDQESEAARDLIASGACGLVIYPVPRPEAMEQPDYLCAEDLGVPVALLDTATDAHPHPQFIFDNEQLGYDVTSWLMERGRTRIAFLRGDAGIVHSPLQAREAGYRRAHAAHGLPLDETLIRRYDAYRIGALRRLAVEVAGMTPRPTAVIATEDLAATELIERLADLGVSVPQDVQVVGFDDRPEAHRVKPPFNTTRPDFERLAERACEDLIRRIEAGTGSAQNASTNARVAWRYVFSVPLLTRRTSEGKFAEQPARSREPDERSARGLAGRKEPGEPEPNRALARST